MNKKTFSFRSVLLMLLIIALIPALGFAHDAAAAQAKTSPPPSSFLAPNTIFHPDFDFLEKGQGYLSYQGDNKVNIWGETYGTVRVNEIGIQITLQRSDRINLDRCVHWGQCQGKKCCLCIYLYSRYLCIIWLLLSC